MADTDEERRRSAKRQLNKWAKIMCQIVGESQNLLYFPEFSRLFGRGVSVKSKGGNPRRGHNLSVTYLPIATHGNGSCVANTGPCSPGVHEQCTSWYKAVPPGPHWDHDLLNPPNISPITSTINAPSLNLHRE